MCDADRRTRVPPACQYILTREPYLRRVTKNIPARGRDKCARCHGLAREEPGDSVKREGEFIIAESREQEGIR